MPKKEKRVTPNPNIPPDIGDPNNHSKSCQSNYKNQESYRQYLKTVHRRKLSPLKQKATIDPATCVDGLQNPNNIDSARLTHSSKRTYNLRRATLAHEDGKYALSSSTILNNQPDRNDPDWYCSSCEKRYANHHNYRRHIQLVHPE